MSQCLQEGDWRAYLDGELPAEEMARAREHLTECAACVELHRGVSARASQVSAWMMELEPAPATAQPAAVSRPVWKWAAVGIALAAALAAAFVLAPRRVETVHAPSIAHSVPDPVEPQVSLPPAVTPVRADRVSQARPLRRKSVRPQYFLGLDEEPIETGVMMRVAFENGIEADVIVDAEGRPRAIRAVK